MLHDIGKISVPDTVLELRQPAGRRVGADEAPHALGRRVPERQAGVRPRRDGRAFAPRALGWRRLPGRPVEDAVRGSSRAPGRSSAARGRRAGAALFERGDLDFCGRTRTRAAA